MMMSLFGFMIPKNYIESLERYKHW